MTCIEVASTSDAYSDFESICNYNDYRKKTIFTDENIDNINIVRRFARLIVALIKYDIIFIGVPYSYLDFWIACWILRICGKKITLMFDSKFDDKRRSSLFEFAKRVGLSCFSSAIFASRRTMAYLEFLGFTNRTLVPGYDTLSVGRIRNEAKSSNQSNVQFKEKYFIYIGRFVEKKNLFFLLDAYADYVAIEGASARRLLLVGSGPLAAELRRRAGSLNVGSLVEFAGFRVGVELAGLLNSSLGLILVSSCEQWGLVINEAVALGIPTIISESPGARDILSRTMVTGWVIEEGSISGLVRAMQELGRSEASWDAMSKAASDRAWFADAERFADAVEHLIDKAAEPATSNIAAYMREMQGQVRR